MDRVVITADGSCLGNPGPGGWAWVFDEACWGAGGHPRTTNNLMELRAVYEALSALPREVPVRIQTDSQYVINVCTQWLPKWQSDGWITAKKQPVANRNAIESLAVVLRDRDVEWRHVKGHSGHEQNELADHLARQAAEAMKRGKPVNEGPVGCISERLRS